MCNICGQPICSNPQYCQSRKPFCDQCTEDSRCVSPFDTQCIIYHFDTNAPSKLINLQLPNGTSLEVILEKIDLLLGGLNIPFLPQDTLTIHWTPGGTKGHSPKADVRISSQPGNHLSAKDDGLFVAPFNENFFVKVDADDIPDYLVNQITGGSDGVVTNYITDTNGLLKIQSSLDILALFNKIRSNYADDFCDLVNSCHTSPSGSPTPCTPVSFASSAKLPPGIVGQPYSYTLPLLGTPPYTISGITKPAWMSIILGGNTVLFGGTPDEIDTNVAVGFSLGNCSGDTFPFSDTITTTSGSPNPNPIVGTFRITCFSGGCSVIGDAGISFTFAQPLVTPLTLKLAARQHYISSGTYQKLGYDIIPGSVPGTNYEPTPVTITIPAGTTTYSTPSYITFGMFAGNFGCYPSCNANYNSLRTTDIYIQLQAPDDAIVMNLTNATSDQYNPVPPITYTQVP